MTTRKLLSNENLLNEVTKKAFNIVDKDLSGYIDYEEFSLLIREISEKGDLDQPSSEEIRQIFDILDLDKSGNIGIDEFKYLILRIIEIEDV